MLYPFIADLQEDWREIRHSDSGAHARKNFPIYTLPASSSSTQIVRIEADVSLKEPWDFLREIAYERQLSLSELINAISQAKSRKVTLASALRVFVAQHYRAAASQRC